MTNPAAAAATAFIRPGDWVADVTGCTVTFSVRNFRLRTVTGQFPLTGAVVTVGPDGRPAGIRAELDAGGVDTGNQRRDSDLRGSRFLSTGQWPAITYTAGQIRASGAGWTIDGTLTVKDTSCPVRLEAGGLTAPPADPSAPVVLHATGHLDRRAAGVTAGPAFLVGHEISISLAVRLIGPATIPRVSS
jgi:polyisoprenoid-binding protein YceI